MVIIKVIIADSGCLVNSINKPKMSGGNLNKEKLGN